MKSSRWAQPEHWPDLRVQDWAGGQTHSPPWARTGDLIGSPAMVPSWLSSFPNSLIFYKITPCGLKSHRAVTVIRTHWTHTYITFCLLITKRDFMYKETIPGIVVKLAPTFQENRGWVSLFGCSDKKWALAPKVSMEWTISPRSQES